MTNDQGLRGLLEIHAVGTPEADGPGLADAIWRHETSADELQAIWVDLTVVFQRLADELESWSNRYISLDYSYPVAEIMTQVSKLVLTAPEPSMREHAALLLWRITTAWDALNATDITDIADHVAGEEWALRMTWTPDRRS